MARLVLKRSCRESRQSIRHSNLPQRSRNHEYFICALHLRIDRSMTSVSAVRPTSSFPVQHHISGVDNESRHHIFHSTSALRQYHLPNPARAGHAAYYFGSRFSSCRLGTALLRCLLFGSWLRRIVPAVISKLSCAKNINTLSSSFPVSLVHGCAKGRKQANIFILHFG